MCRYSLDHPVALVLLMKMQLVFVLVCITSLVVEAEVKLALVKTSLGKIRGYTKQSFHGRQYHAFEGVPYAEPPVGELRFQPPMPTSPWEGILLATRPQSECLQYNHLPKNPPERVEGSEDCLYLNIYTPAEDSKKLLPVIFYIHGGAFQFGCGYNTGPRYILDRDVVLVNFNYRLGPLGFLSTEDTLVPGNMGLKDQNMALKWVSQNIQHFGGDPQRITLAGLSAGGASVHYHYLSPLSRGLFRGGMSFSGTALDCWTQTENALEKANKLGDILGCPTGDTSALVECLMSRPAYSIVQAVGEFMPWRYNPYTPFGPVVEVSSPGAFVDRSPVDIISSGYAADVPWMTSLTSEEGLYPAAEYVANKKLMRQLDENWDVIAPHLLDFNFTIAASQRAQVAEKIRHHYLGSRKINKDSAMDLIHLVGDRLFAVDAEKAARMMAKANRNPVWFYVYTYQGPYSLSDAFIPSGEKFGVSHGDDVFLVLRHLDDPVITDKTALAMQNKLMDIWVSFVNNKAPDAGVEWKNINPSNDALQYLHIFGPKHLEMEENDNFGEKLFWSTIDFHENEMGSCKEEL